MYPNDQATCRAKQWLQKKATIQIVYEANRRELLNVNFTPGHNKIRVFGAMVCQLEQLGQYHFVRNVLGIDNPQDDGEIGYLLLIGSRLLRIYLSREIAATFTGAKRKLSLSGPIYSPYMLQDDALAILLSLSSGDFESASRMCWLFVENESLFGSEIQPPPNVLATPSFAMRLTSLACNLDVPRLTYARLSNPAYDNIIKSLNAINGWDSAVEALLNYCSSQSKLSDDYSTEYNVYPYEIYPVALYAAMAVKRRGYCNIAQTRQLPSLWTRSAKLNGSDIEPIEWVLSQLRKGFPSDYWPSFEKCR